MDERDADKLTFIEADTGDNVLEWEADDFASRALIPREFEHRLRDLRTEPEIQQFAEELGIYRDRRRSTTTRGIASIP
jgi:Zn-dependent peptidase ImmA (M78 family)